MRPTAASIIGTNQVRIVETTLGTGPHSETGPLFALFERLLRAVFPAANPNFEKHYEAVAKWWVEVDPDGIPQRELGFDHDDTVIVAAPLGNNFGFFTDTCQPVFDTDEFAVIEARAFEAAWNEFEKSWTVLVQPEMERGRSPLVSIPPCGRGFLRHRGLPIRCGFFEERRSEASVLRSSSR